MVAKTRMALERFLALPEIDEKRLELIGGEVHEKMAPRWAHGALAMEIGFLLRPYGFPAAEPRAIIPGGADRDASSPLPDLAFYVRGRPADNDWMTRPPDIAVEILSHGQRRQELRAKIELYRAWGIRSVWMVDPERRSIDVYEGDGSTTFSGSDVIRTAVVPELDATVEGLFASIEEPRD
jgi:Uma2 family endonuclease